MDIMQGERFIKKAGKDETAIDNYACDPTDNEAFCIFYYRGIADFSNKKFSVPCKCALDGQKGYCGTILGTIEYETALVDLKRMLEKSDCHSLDRATL